MVGTKRVKTKPQALLPPHHASQAHLEWFHLACFVWGLVFCLIFRAQKQLCPPNPSVTYRKDPGVAQRIETGRNQGSTDFLSDTEWLSSCRCTGHQAKPLGFTFPGETELSIWVRCLQPCLFSSLPPLSYLPCFLSFPILFSPTSPLPFLFL